jgi:hypothetical protein
MAAPVGTRDRPPDRNQRPRGSSLIPKLTEFRARLVEHGIEEKALDLLLAAVKDKGLVKADLTGHAPRPVCLPIGGQLVTPPRSHHPHHADDGSP